MSKLVCNYSTFNTKVSNINEAIAEYTSILSQIEGLESNTEYMWKADSQKAYYNKFMQRKADLEQLSTTYKEIVEFLNDVIKNYQNIESKYL